MLGSFCVLATVFVFVICFSQVKAMSALSPLDPSSFSKPGKYFFFLGTAFPSSVFKLIHTCG